MDTAPREVGGGYCSQEKNGWALGTAPKGRGGGYCSVYQLADNELGIIAFP